MITNETLLRHIPNYIASGYNETKLLEKIQPSVEIAGHWADTNICPRVIAAEAPKLSGMLDDIIALRALCIAAPMLDVTMHPNGLAIVNTESLAPASAERSKEFRTALDGHLVDFIDKFIYEITGYNKLPSKWEEYKTIRDLWSSSIPAKTIWHSTIFPGCGELLINTGNPKSWEKFISILPVVSSLELQIAERGISFDLLRDLRTDHYGADVMNYYIHVTHFIKRAIRSYFESPMYIIDTEFMRSAVELIRKNPDAFPQWHKSATARLFDPPVFKNKKKSGGFFF